MSGVLAKVALVLKYVVYGRRCEGQLRFIKIKCVIFFYMHMPLFHVSIPSVDDLDL